MDSYVLALNFLFMYSLSEEVKTMGSSSSSFHFYELGVER